MSGSSVPGRKLVGARELKTRLGKYLRAVQRGATLTVTERGVPVARLSPVSRHEEGIDAVLDELESEGIISRGSGEVLEPGRAVKARGEPIERTVARDRDDRL
jgi:prevent-host-death family protein